MSNVETRFIENMFAILKVDAGLLALVDVTNIRPSFDVSVVTPGSGLISFNWASFNYNPQQKKGKGTLRVTCAHPDTAEKARGVFDIFTALCTAASLNSSDCGVALFREDDNSEGVGPKVENQYNVPSNWKVLLTTAG